MTAPRRTRLLATCALLRGNPFTGAIPSLGEWALALLSLATASLGLAALRRKRA